MLTKIIQKVLGDPNEKEIKRIKKIVEKINAQEEQYQALTEEQLKAKTKEFQERIKNGETENDLLVEAFAVVKNAARRLCGKSWEVRGNTDTWNMVHYDCQLVGGIVLHEGKIAEMKTGEGKTLVAAAPVYLNALSGKGAWVVTVNEYLTQRDAEWIGGLYRYLGLTVGVIINAMTTDERQMAYACDIVYGTNNEFGFDYLRDNMATDPKAIVQRELNYCIVDEVDSILIDEARTPLIISAPAEKSDDRYTKYASIVPQLQKGTDYQVDEKLRAATLTEIGIRKLEKILGMENIYEEAGFVEVHHIEQALKAHAVFERDKDYVVKDGEVMIVDEFTGRIMPGRRYSDGLHQAIEAKEHVEIKRESKTLATVTFQNYFRLFKKLAGMTGTAITEAEEFFKIYKLEVIVIPTNKPVVRQDSPDVIYKNQSAKFQAIAKKVKELNAKGQPVLVGTVSVDQSELLHKLFTQTGIAHSVLNAKHHQHEAEIVAKAGQKGAVTIATNMAGRGTDIKLGEGVIDLGGLFILGSERHESRRIDNQLRGRAGRQGDPGVSQFYVSMEDSLMRIFGGERMQKIMNILKVPDNEALESGMLSRSIEQAQKRVEGHHFDIRKHLVEYDDVLNKHREIIYSRRRKILFHENIRDQIETLITEDADNIIRNFTGGKPHEWQREAIWEEVKKIYEGEIPAKNLWEETESHEEIAKLVEDYLQNGYKERESQLEEVDMLRKIEKQVYLRTIDRFWMDHIDAMAHLREGIGLKSYAQRDPLVEYKAEGYRRFTELLGNIQHATIMNLFHIRLDHIIEVTEKMKALQEKQAQQQSQAQASGAAEPGTTKDDGASVIYRSPQAQAQAQSQVLGIKKPTTNQKVGRNDPCPCGSGKKYKKCCGANE